MGNILTIVSQVSFFIVNPVRGQKFAIHTWETPFLRVESVDSCLSSLMENLA